MKVNGCPEDDDWFLFSKWVCTFCSSRVSSSSTIRCHVCGQHSFRATPKVTLPEYAWISQQLSYPLLTSIEDMATKPTANGGEFSLAPSFHPRVIEAAVLRGIFPMTTLIWKQAMPAYKLHHERCVFDYTNGSLPHVRRSTVKKAGRYRFVINRDADAMARALVMLDQEQGKRHGRSWLCPELARALLFIQRNPEQFPNVKIFVWELYSIANDELAAVEIGYAVGRIYTSMTGAYAPNHASAGSLQLAVTGTYLMKLGFRLWDFGMAMTYKVEMGASEISRADWIQVVSTQGVQPIFQSFQSWYNCREYLNMETFINEID